MKKAKQVIQTNEEPTFVTKSAKIRYLASIGKSKAEIAKIMDVRYQHVRNVLLTPLKKK